MATSSLRIGAGSVLLLTALTTSGPVRADWPTARHDVHRTGASSTGSDIKKPAPYWRARLGGAPGQVYMGDVNKDGLADVLYIAGGELALTDAKGSIVWRTGSRGYTQMLGVADVDLDGQPDVIVSSGSKVTIVNGATGVVEWDEPAGELGTLGAFRVGDVNGDGAPDLWLDTCGCCEVETNAPGFVYSFKGGFTAPAQLGPPPPRIHCGATSNTMGDFLGNGRLQMIEMGLINGAFSAQMFGSDGTILATSGVIPTRSQCEAIDIDGQPGAELVCFSNDSYAGGGVRGVFALGYRPAETPSLKLLWQFSASALADGDARAPANVVVDLDGDGKLEAVVSGKAGGVYTTYVLDAQTGAQIATVGGIAAGDVPATAAGQRWLLVAQDFTVNAQAFTRSPAALTSVWKLTGERVATQYNWSRSQTSGLAGALLTPTLTGAKQGLLLSSTAEPQVLSAYDTATGAPLSVASYALDTDVSASLIGTPNAFTGTGSLVVARSDGFIAMLDAGLAPMNQTKAGPGTLPGMFAGGYYAGPGAQSGYGRAPIAGKLKPGDTADALLVVDSRGDLVRLNPSGATNLSPATPAWRLADSFGAGLRAAGATSAGTIGVYRRRHPLTDPPQYVIATVDPDGKELASLPLNRTPLFDVLPGNFAGDGTTGFVGVDTDALNVDITVMSGAGQKVWQQSLVPQWSSRPVAVGDWDGDGADDVAAVINVAHVYSGKTGVETVTGTAFLGYFMPILTSLEAGPQLDMLLQGGVNPVGALDNGLKPLWTSATTTAPYPYGSLATCASGTTLVEGTFTTPAQLAFTQAAGASAGTTTTIILASGMAYPDVASAKAANAAMGQLTDVAVSTNLDGTGSGPTALVGSSDGYLYAVDPCTGALRWARSFGVPVGSPILADTDGDGKDEILVSVADGYLYALKNEALPAPAYVWDTDPPHGVTSKDVSDIQTTNTLYASWAPVPGATSYEVAVVGSDLTYITTPAWIDVGVGTSAAIPNLKLVDSGEYIVGVRAVSPTGKSPDAVSNGVVVHLPATMDGGMGGGGTGGTAGTGGTGGMGGGPAAAGGCGCSTPGGETGRWMAPLGVLTALALVWSRRRKRA